MGRINRNFQKLPGNYLFTETARRGKAWEDRNPGKNLIRLGIGDVTLPLPKAAAEAIAQAAEEMKVSATFRGYGPEQGYQFLREAICHGEYAARGVEIAEDEIFISDGIKSECGAVLELFDRDTAIALGDPVYPAYIDAAAIAGRAGDYDKETGYWSELIYLPCTEDMGFVPCPPKGRADIVYLCYPNNPTGAVATRQQLTDWVDWANKTGAVILFDGAYERFIADPNIPHSIYEISGAENCAVEFRSFSKTAGFTGVRCGYTVIPKVLKRDGVSLHTMWKRRLTAKSNGVSYVVQRGAAAIYSDEGISQVEENITYYHENASIISSCLQKQGLTVYGGENAPYVWVKTPDGMNSWEFFDLLLEECGILTTPGAGFGPRGEGFVRLTAFGERMNIEQAMVRIVKIGH